MILKDPRNGVPPHQCSRFCCRWGRFDNGQRLICFYTGKAMKKGELYAGLTAAKGALKGPDGAQRQPSTTNSSDVLRKYE